MLYNYYVEFYFYEDIMQIYNTIEPSSPCCIALGCFDGIHIGHQKIIRSMCSYAQESGLESAVFTFSSSPAAVLGKAPKRVLISKSDKMHTLETLGVDKCFSVDFTSVRNISPEDFIKQILIGTLNARAVFCGFNFRFGKLAKGDCETLSRICGENGIEAFVSSPVCYGDKAVSSSRIRELIENGDILTANRLLAHPFSVEQIITEGKHNGRTVGIPTVNQNLPDGFVTPRFGVYASFVYIDGKRYEGITNVGVRPTVGGTDKNMETHILSRFYGDMYGKNVRTELLEFVRDERKFDNLEQLAAQIKKDIAYIYDNSIYNKY